MHIYLLNKRSNSSSWIIDVLNNTDFERNPEYKIDYDVTLMLKINEHNTIFKDFKPVIFEGSILSMLSCIYSYITGIDNKTSEALNIVDAVDRDEEDHKHN